MKIELHYENVSLSPDTFKGLVKIIKRMEKDGDTEITLHARVAMAEDKERNNE